MYQNLIIKALVLSCVFALVGMGAANAGFILPSKEEQSQQQAAPQPSSSTPSPLQSFIAPPKGDNYSQEKPQGYSGLVGGETGSGTDNAAPTSSPAKSYADLEKEKEKEAAIAAEKAKAAAAAAAAQAQAQAEAQKQDQAAAALATGNVPLQSSMNIPEMETPKVDAATKEALSKQVVKVNGMSPVEYVMKSKVDDIMKQVASTSGFSAAEKAGAIDQARMQLMSMAEGLRMRNNVTGDVLKKMDMPENYIKDTVEGNQKALERVNSAILSLKGK